MIDKYVYKRRMKNEADAKAIYTQLKCGFFFTFYESAIRFHVDFYVCVFVLYFVFGKNACVQSKYHSCSRVII